MMPTRAIPGAIGEPDQIGRMKVAHHPGLGRGGGLLQQLAPHRDEFGAQLGGRLGAAIGQIPFEHQPDLDQQASMSKTGMV